MKADKILATITLHLAQPVTKKNCLKMIMQSN